MSAAPITRATTKALQQVEEGKRSNKVYRTRDWAPKRVDGIFRSVLEQLLLVADGGVAVSFRQIYDMFDANCRDIRSDPGEGTVAELRKETLRTHEYIRDNLASLIALCLKQKWMIEV